MSATSTKLAATQRAPRGKRIVVFGAVVLVAAVAITVSVVGASSSHKAPGGATLPAEAFPSGGLDGAAGRFILFRNTHLDRAYGKVALVPASKADGPRAFSTMDCDRAAFAGGRGLCLIRPRNSPIVQSEAVVFDAHLGKLHSSTLAGYPSRAQVSPSGRFGSVTTFVSGDSYATLGQFSTRTEIIDLGSGNVVFDLEKLAVRKDGSAFQQSDFNFWGVTFATDDDTFYATLGTGDQTYLVKGSIAGKSATVLRSGVECPSLSPDGKRIAFKQRQPGAKVTWRLAVLDLDTLADHPLAETRNVDDQAAWLDDSTVLYGLASDAAKEASLAADQPGLNVLTRGGTLATDTWRVPADGSGAPVRYLEGAWSSGVAR